MLMKSEPNVSSFQISTSKPATPVAVSARQTARANRTHPPTVSSCWGIPVSKSGKYLSVSRVTASPALRVTGRGFERNTLRAAGSTRVTSTSDIL